MIESPKKHKCQLCGGSRIEIIPRGKYAVAQACSDCFLSCDQCDGLGYVFTKDERGREFALKCECQTVLRKISLFNNARIPGQFYGATLHNFDTHQRNSLKEALQTAKFFIKKYQQGQSKGLLFMGGVGVGKTRLVCSMVREFIFNHNIPCLFREFQDLLREIKSGYDEGKSETGLLEEINNTEVLVIDELGKGKKSDWEIAKLDDIISARYNMGKATIFTTNYTERLATTYVESIQIRGDGGEPKIIEKKETLKQRILPRNYSRLKEMCDFTEINETDYRQLNV